MASIDSVSLTILFGAVLVLAGIMSSLVALRFGAPLLLVFLLVGMLAGESGIGGIKFDDVRLAYTVGSVALGLILFDGGLRTRLATFRNVLDARRPARHRRRADHHDHRRAGRGLGARPDLDGGASGRRGDGLDRRRGGVLPAPRQGAAAAPARLRHLGGRVRHQRSVRDLPHAGAGRDAVLRQPGLGRDRGAAAGERHHRRLHRLDRRAADGAGAEPPGAAAGHARAVRRHRRAGDLRPRRMVARLGLPRRLCRRPRRRQPRDPRPQHHRHVPRRRHLARPDRDVRAARPAGLAGAAAAAAAAGARRRADA